MFYNESGVFTLPNGSSNKNDISTKHVNQTTASAVQQIISLKQSTLKNSAKSDNESADDTADGINKYPAQITMHK